MIEDLTPEPAQTPIAAALETVTTNVAEFSKVAAGLAALREKHPVNLVCPVDTPAGMREAIAGRAAWREPRVKLEAMRKAAKAPVLALGKQIDSTAAELEAQLRIGESNYDDQIKAQEKIAADRKAAAERAEAERVQVLKDRIATHYTSKPARMFGKSAADIQACIQAMTGDVTEAEFFDFTEDAKTAQAHALETLRAMHATQEATEAREAEQARVAAEQVAEANRLAKLAAELQAQADKDRAAFEAEQAQARKMQDAREAEERARRDAAEAEARAEREAIAAEQKKLDDAKREEADRLAAVERERLDKEAEAKRLDDERAAFLERKRLDDAAAAEREQQAKEAEKERKAFVREQKRMERLHKTAPRMLAALQALEPWHHESEAARLDPAYSAIVDECRAAAAEAEGAA